MLKMVPSESAAEELQFHLNGHIMSFHSLPTANTPTLGNVPIVVF